MSKGCMDAFRVYGTTTVGERGQVVIPVDARKHFTIGKGDQFLVIAGGHHEDIIGLVPIQAIDTFVKHFKLFAENLEKEVKKIKK